MDTDEAGSVTETEATLNATFADGGSEVTVAGFKYGTDAALSSPTDVAGSGTTSPFTAALTGLTHATQYWAVGYATNAVGTSYGDTITFTTLAFAPTVDTDAAGSVTETEATLNATFTDGGSAVTATGFKYGTNALLTSPTDVAGSGTTSPFTAALTGLTASTQYWAVGYATNAVGTSYGDTITFTTSTPTSCSVPSVTYDGYTYTTVSIGTQCWFKENLRNDNYANGTAIPGVPDNTAWGSSTSGAFTIYDHDGANEATNLATYGRLYNWYAVIDPAGLCPTGWHVPTDAEWTTLETALGGTSGAGEKMKVSASNTPVWDGNNSSGFSALPAGSRNYNGYFNDLGFNGGWWSSSPNGGDAVARFLYSGGPSVDRNYSGPRNGFSVRCIQDPPTAPTVDTDAAGSVTETEATLNATFTDGGSAVTATGFKYGTDALLTSPTDVAGGGTSSPFTAALTGLTASTQYWAVGYATNALGTSYGDTITFTTSAPTSCSVPSVTYDGYTYTTVSIGTQCWFKENLRNENYSDGTPIPGWIDAATWSGRTIGAQGIAGEGGSNAASNLATYGRLYNAYAVLNEAGLCPTGWHVPTLSEFDVLHTAIGGDAASLKSSPSDTPAWNGSNTSGFSALPSGYINTSGATEVVGAATIFWSSSFNNSTNTRTRVLTTDFSSSTHSNVFGFSVRCLQDPPTAPTVDTDAAGSVTETEATLNATFTDGGSEVTATGFKYGTDAALSSPTDVAGSGTTSPFTAALTGLTASTQYWAVGYATNSVGTSYGDTITFTTSAPTSCSVPSVTYEGYTYTTVSIGTQCWFKENLRNENYSDGTPIPGNLDGTAWTGTSSGAQAVYGEGSSAVYHGSDDEAANLAFYGRLYNWYAVKTGKLCPSGWHVPFDSEWTSLVTVLGSAAGDQMKASIPDWDGNNSSEFSALPGGTRAAFDGSFDSQGLKTLFWSSSPTSDAGWIRILNSGNSGVSRGTTNPRNGLSVRCVQDNDD